MPFPTIDPSVNEYYNPITEATYRRGPNDVWTQVDAFNKVDVSTLKDAFDDEYVNRGGDEMTGPLILNHTGNQTISFELLGRRPGSDASVVDEQVLWLYHNNGTIGDEINYNGGIVGDENIVNKKYVDDAISAVEAGTGFLPLEGGTLTNALSFQRGTKATPQWKITPNSGNYATNIYSLGNGEMRFRTSHTADEGDSVGSHIVLNPNGGVPETKIYNVVETNATGAVPRSYVDALAGIPVGAIMIWMNSAVPDGWFKLQGGDFDINAYPLLHAYLQSTDSYVSGTLPDWKGHYPGEYGDHLAGVSLGKKLGQRTAMPNGGAPTSSNSIPNGNVRTFTATGNTNAYSNGIAQVSISEGWDAVTRPQTVVVHYIIKHD